MKNKRFTLIDVLIIAVIIAAGFIVSRVMTPDEVTLTERSNLLF